MIGFYNFSVILTYIGAGISFIGITQLFENNFNVALLCLVLSGVCDMFDGKIARLVKRSEDECKFGIEIDSFCDLICFGVFPALFAYRLGMEGIPGIIILILYLICTVIRLGYFNVTEQERQNNNHENRTVFQGVPVTTVAITFPLVYLSQSITGKYFCYILSGFMLLSALSFITNFKVKKLTGKFFTVLILIAVFVFAKLFNFI